MSLYCCGCEEKVEARLTSGAEIYPHRPDLHALSFWRCDACGNHVGCHHKTENPTRPLGCIPTKEVKNARKHIHRILDPLWKAGPYNRNEIYGLISDHIGREYHTAQIRTVEEARNIYRFVLKLKRKAT